ncbi:MAG TPA: PEGA domain-containing protein [Gemmatimonadaceae bacterium]|nr:PEGA domain-containing protein [Gemmatimonadaceae bacterium]
MSHTPRNAPNEPYIVFADQRRLRLWRQAFLRRTAYALLGAITIGAGAFIVHRVSPNTFTSVDEFERLLGIAPKDSIAAVTRLTGSPSATLTSSKAPLPAPPRTKPATASTTVARTAPPKPSTPQKSSIVRPREEVLPPLKPPAPPAGSNAAPVVTTSSSPGWLVVSSRPWGNLYIDGRLVGNTPQATVWLTPGTHKVEIKRDGFKAFLANVSIDSNREFRLTRVTLDPATQ